MMMSDRITAVNSFGKMEDFTRKEVENVITEEPKDIREIAEEVLSMRGYDDPEWHKVEAARMKASEAMIEPLTEGKITSTPDWKYRQARRTEE